MKKKILLFFFVDGTKVMLISRFPGLQKYIIITSLCMGIFSKKHGCLTVAKRQKSFWVDIDKHVPARFVTCCGYLKHFRCGLCVFAACFCIWLCCAYLQHVSVFGCVVRICSAFLYLVVLLVFAAGFCIWLCCAYLQRISVLGHIVSICGTFLYLIVL